MNFANMCSNIPASPAYGVYISKIGEIVVKAVPNSVK
jgi:hypothetical protein